MLTTNTLSMLGGFDWYLLWISQLKGVVQIAPTIIIIFFGLFRRTLVRWLWPFSPVLLCKELKSVLNLMC